MGKGKWARSNGQGRMGNSKWPNGQMSKGKWASANGQAQRGKRKWARANGRARRGGEPMVKDRRAITQVGCLLPPHCPLPRLPLSLLLSPHSSPICPSPHLLTHLPLLPCICSSAITHTPPYPYPLVHAPLPMRLCSIRLCPCALSHAPFARFALAQNT